ncbi:MAG: alkyl sulfatase dimerization domain-containing protein [Alphaproteobacteria bacterium]
MSTSATELTALVERLWRGDAALAGGADRLAQRAAKLAADGQTRLAAHLIELAVGAAPDDAALHRIRAEIYARCMEAETSLIGKAIFAVAQRESKARSEK